MTFRVPESSAFLLNWKSMSFFTMIFAGSTPRFVPWAFVTLLKAQHSQRVQVPKHEAIRLFGPKYYTYHGRWGLIPSYLGTWTLCDCCRPEAPCGSPRAHRPGRECPWARNALQIGFRPKDPPLDDMAVSRNRGVSVVGVFKIRVLLSWGLFMLRHSDF